MLNTSYIKKTLKSFQQAGSDFLVRHPHALLADEPGLGKTVQAIDAAERLELKRVLVVCPASVRSGWRQELDECGATGTWDVLSYEQIVRGQANLGQYDGVIFDEAHYLKTPESQRTQAALGRSGVARHPRIRVRWALTGTPVLNRPRELWPILKCLHPGFSDASWGDYATRYCAAHFNGREIDTRGASHLDELQGRLVGFMLRRRKEEVMSELPRRIVTRVPLKLGALSQAVVDRAEAEILDREAKLSAAKEDFSALGDLATMLHAVGIAKLSATLDFIVDLLEVQDKVVVFYKHTDVGEELGRTLAREGIGSVIYRGGMTDAQKRTAVATFQGVAQVFLGQIQAAGTGINGLQEVCSSVVFAELDWTPGVLSQAIDRLHRIGQPAISVNAYLLHAPGTMESAVLAVENTKGSVVGKLMGEMGWKT